MGKHMPGSRASEIDYFVGPRPRSLTNRCKVVNGCSLGLSNKVSQRHQQIMSMGLSVGGIESNNIRNLDD